jgi:hypothetical protein
MSVVTLRRCRSRYIRGLSGIIGETPQALAHRGFSVIRHDGARRLGYDPAAIEEESQESKAPKRRSRSIR